MVPPAFRPIPVCNFTSGEILDLDWYWVVLADSMGFAFQVCAASPRPATALASLTLFLDDLSFVWLRWCAREVAAETLKPSTENPQSRTRNHMMIGCPKGAQGESQARF